VVEPLTKKASAAALRRERDAAVNLPYARHVTDQIVGLDSGALMACLRLDGASFETADAWDLNIRHAKLNGAWRNIASDRLAIWHHLIRRQDVQYPHGAFTTGFARTLDEAYRTRLAGDKLFVNELYLSVVLHPGHDRYDQAQALLGRLKARGQNQRGQTDDVRILQDAVRDLTHYLGRYGPRPLGLDHRQGLAFSQPMQFLRLVLTGAVQPTPLVRGHLGSAIYDARTIFGREALEIRDVAQARFAGMLGVKEYPATTRPGLWDSLLSASFPFVLTQSFSFLSKAAAQAVMGRKQNQMLSARDRAASQIQGLDTALDDLASNRFVMGDHQASMLVYGSDLASLSDRLSRARAVLADSGLVVAREDLGLEAAFWAQFPGNFKYRVRPAAISSKNFAAFAPFHTHPPGKSSGNHWGAAIALLRTSSGSPFYFNFHVGDLGHTFICGPSGAGKTVVQNFMLAQLEKFGAQQVFIDKDRGSEIFIRARHGTYLAFKPGQPTGFAPFKALDYSPANRLFLANLVRQLAAPSDRALTPLEARAIDDAVSALEPMPVGQRSILALRSLLGQRDAAGLGARLERWCHGSALGWVLDNEQDALSLRTDLLGFDITQILDAPEIRTPLLMYLFHRLQALVDGRRLVIDIDEFWKALGDEAFRGLAQDGLNTYRKQNALMIFGTLSPAEVVRSPIAHTILEQCATKIFLPNPQASRADYVDGFGLSEREYTLVRQDLAATQRRFLIKQGLNAVVAELDLSGLDDALAVLSGRTETIALLDRLRREHGDDPAHWMEPFHQARRHL
jgi:type IV secretion system protein VirB4